jgi:hypothetical protein
MDKKNLCSMITDNFKGHVAKYDIVDDKISKLVWKNPKSSYYYIRYILDYNKLYVSGDCFSAIYEWGQQIGLQFLAACNLDYFSSKCVASKYGPGYKSWDSDVAQDYLRISIDDYIKESYTEEYASEDFNSNDFRDYRAEFYKSWEIDIDQMYASCSSEFEFAAWVNSSTSDSEVSLVLEVFGQDYWEVLYSIGKVVNIECMYHHEGLRAAVKYLMENMFCYPDCEHMSPTEAEQNDNKEPGVPHLCKKYGIRIRHENHHPYLMRCVACDYKK